MTTDRPVTPSATARLRAFVRRPWVTMSLAGAAVVAVVGLGQLRVPTPVAASDAPVREPVASAELVCPVTGAASGLVSTVSAGVAPLPSVTDGVASLADLTTRTTSAQPLVITQPGRSVTRLASGSTGPAQLARATGSFAAGFGADQMLISGQGTSRGLAVSPCARPVTDAWLVGGGSTVGRLTQVLLVNDDDRPAQVDLDVYGPGGPLDAPAGSGIVVPPSSRTTVRLDRLAPNLPVAAVHVVARSGRVGVAGLDQAVHGLVPLGLSILPATQAGTRLVIPDVPAPVLVARLHLIAPDSDASVTIRLLTDDGPLTPAGFGQLQLTAGKVTSVDVTAALAGLPAGLLITSDAPVAAGVEVKVGTGPQAQERDAAGAVPELTGPAVVAGLQRGPLVTTVALAAPAAASTVRLALVASGGSSSWTRVVVVPRGAVRRVSVPVSTPAASILVVTPVSGGPVYAERQVTESTPAGPMLALAPLVPTRATALVPAVVPIPGSALR